jgi:hypothetical protein
LRPTFTFQFSHVFIRDGFERGGLPALPQMAFFSKDGFKPSARRRFASSRACLAFASVIVG